MNGPRVRSRRRRRSLGRRCGPARGSAAFLHAFTLIEVLVALTIASVALMAALRAVGSMTQSATDLRLRTLAQWSAENRLAQVRLQVGFDNAPLGRRSYACPQADVALRCDEEVFSMPAPQFRRIEVSVYAPEVEGATNRLARMVGFATTFGTP